VKAVRLLCKVIGNLAFLSQFLDLSTDLLEQFSLQYRLDDAARQHHPSLWPSLSSTSNRLYDCCQSLIHELGKRICILFPHTVLEKLPRSLNDALVILQSLFLNSPFPTPHPARMPSRHRFPVPLTFKQFFTSGHLRIVPIQNLEPCRAFTVCDVRPRFV